MSETPGRYETGKIKAKARCQFLSFTPPYEEDIASDVVEYVQQLSPGARLAIARQQNDMKQQTLAKKLGLSRECVSRYERGHQEIPRGIRIALVAILNTPAEWFD